MLSPLQIGLLSKHIQNAIKKHPILVGNIYEKHTSQKMEPWEEELSNLIICDNCLPSYDYMVNKESEILEFLVEYFT